MEGKELMRDELYPVLNTRFKTTKDVSIKSQGVIKAEEEHQISGVGFGKLKEDGTRTEYWIVLSIYDPNQKSINIRKVDMEKLYDSGVAEDC